MLLIQILFALALLFVGIVFAALAVRLARSDTGAFERNRKRSKSIRSVIRGQANAREDASPDGLCHEAIAVDARKNRWIPQAALSDEAVDSLLTRSGND